MRVGEEVTASLETGVALFPSGLSLHFPSLTFSLSLSLSPLSLSVPSSLSPFEFAAGSYLSGWGIDPSASANHRASSAFWPVCP